MQLPLTPSKPPIPIFSQSPQLQSYARPPTRSSALERRQDGSKDCTVQSNCMLPPHSPDGTGSGTVNNNNMNAQMALFGVGIILLFFGVGLGGWIFYRRRKKRSIFPCFGPLSESAHLQESGLRNGVRYSNGAGNGHGGGNANLHPLSRIRRPSPSVVVLEGRNVNDVDGNSCECRCDCAGGDEKVGVDEDGNVDKGGDGGGGKEPTQRLPPAIVVSFVKDADSSKQSHI
ncbi:uncharacterized protein EI90DRAFT_2556840 [Cantharellus anzutake]|uniref:uncharacterized protein n=1 Tax=Cantharellus anzutake TaxID=1750568 RepID=UPI0019037FD7|nr:uncharacterized protein EI90DRAFT_2556840 [Cantharellus anzutake]KAF8338172.1 hypothetical protein EI90DRAFT_2556840 [Cantharellus anzutake]